MLEMQRVKDVVRKAKEDGLKIMIDVDMNVHIWELDEYENKNGKLIGYVRCYKLQILNCV